MSTYKTKYCIGDTVYKVAGTFVEEYTISSLNITDKNDGIEISYTLRRTDKLTHIVSHYLEGFLVKTKEIAVKQALANFVAANGCSLKSAEIVTLEN